MRSWTPRSSAFARLRPACCKTASAVRIVAIVQARMGSTRLPGKVLADLAGRPMVTHVLERARRIEGVDEVVAAIPDLAEDDSLAGAIEALGLRVIRGSADDVLDRYLVAAEASDADAVVRVTADCPLLSPAVSSGVVAAFVADEVDYASNTLERTYPQGLDTEVMAATTLRAAADEAVAPEEREHVTPFIWRRPERFRLRSVRGTPDRSALRWTVDEADDLAFARAVYAELGPRSFDVAEVLELLERRPEIGRLNAGVAQKPLA
jgi:spore coat polysaccharide biosynthesis protein SpsF